MLSIGLGQDQQFTLILQNLQQIRDVYGDSVDKIIQGNVSNIIFLKSTDDDMIQTLEKMSGTTHKTYINSKTVRRNLDKIWMKNEGEIAYNVTTEQEPVISYNDMAFIADRNSIVFRAGKSPIWNRVETCLPMSWRLYLNTIQPNGEAYSMQTVPTLSTAIDFDVRKNQPDFIQMFDKRKRQAIFAKKAIEYYKEAYGYTDMDIERLDPDVYSDEIMEIINDLANADQEEFDIDMDFYETATENVELNNARAEIDNATAKNAQIRYVNSVTRADFFDGNSKNYEHMRSKIEEALRYINFERLKERAGNEFEVDAYEKRFTRNGELMFHFDKSSTTENGIDCAVYVEDAFIDYLVSLDSWDHVFGGEFVSSMNSVMNGDL